MAVKWMKLMRKAELDWKAFQSTTTSFPFIISEPDSSEPQKTSFPGFRGIYLLGKNEGSELGAGGGFTPPSPPLFPEQCNIAMKPSSMLSGPTESCKRLQNLAHAKGPILFSRMHLFPSLSVTSPRLPFLFWASSFAQWRLKAKPKNL